MQLIQLKITIYKGFCKIVKHLSSTNQIMLGNAPTVSNRGNYTNIEYCKTFTIHINTELI